MSSHSTVLHSTFPLGRSPLRRTSPGGGRIRKSSAVGFASKSDGGYGRDAGGGDLVDENMVVLRKRIREMEMSEKKSHHEPPSDWMEWERRYYASYHNSDVCEVVGLLQTVLMNTRPGVVLAVAALLALCLPTSAALMGWHLMELVKRILP